MTTSHFLPPRSHTRDDCIQAWLESCSSASPLLGLRLSAIYHLFVHLAAAYKAAGRAAEAFPLHEQALAAFERVLGPHHPATLTSRNNLAAADRAAGRAD